MSDIMETTGLKKGGIYNHFESKEELALESLRYAVTVLGNRIDEALNHEGTIEERLQHFMEVTRELLLDVPIPGGCPIMNAAVESDDTHPALRELARNAMNRMLGKVREALHTAIFRGELKPEVDPDDLASVLVSSMEGALMMSRLYGHDEHIQRAIRHNLTLLRHSVVPAAST
jgi:TetR/AcrR family transcriptional regulator, transcriptional repressor for nem operon